MGSLKTGIPILDAFVGVLFMKTQVVEEITTKVRKFLTWLINIVITFLSNFFFGKPENRELVEKECQIKYVDELNNVNKLHDKILWFLNHHSDVEKLNKFVASQSDKDFEIIISPQTNHLCKLKYKGKELSYEISKKIIHVYAHRKEEREISVITLKATFVKDEEDDEDYFKKFLKSAADAYTEYKQTANFIRKVYTNNSKGEWEESPSKTARKMQTIYLRDGQLEALIEDFNEFLSSENWYIEKGLSYRRGYFFKGNPGTGKTSLIDAMANHSNRSLYRMRLKSIKSRDDFMSLLKRIENKRKAIIVIEDIDVDNKAIISRVEAEKEEAKDAEDKKGKQDVPEKCTMKDFLEWLDGSSGDCHGMIVVASTNHPEKIDPAVTRAGRFDHHVEFKYCNVEQIFGIFKIYFPNSKKFFTQPPSNETTIPACDISNICVSQRKHEEVAFQKIQDLIQKDAQKKKD